MNQLREIWRTLYNICLPWQVLLSINIFPICKFIYNSGYSIFLRSPTKLYYYGECYTFFLIIASTHVGHFANVKYEGITPVLWLPRFGRILLYVFNVIIFKLHSNSWLSWLIYLYICIWIAQLKDNTYISSSQ